MKYSIAILLMVLSAMLFGQEQDYKSGIMVLKDGRIVAMRGVYEVFGDEVQFTDGNGQMVVLPLAKVDLEETDKRNSEIEEKSKGLEIEDDGTLYSQVMRHRLKEGRSLDETDPKYSEKDMKQYFEEVYEKDEKKNASPVADIAGVSNWQKQLEEQGVDLQALGGAAIGVMVVAGLAALFALVMNIYLTFRGFGESVIWGLALSSVLVGPFILNVVSFFIAGSSPGLSIVLGFASSGLSLLSLVLFPAFIITCCHGSRIKLGVLWALPYLVMIGCVVGLFVMAFTAAATAGGG